MLEHVALTQNSGTGQLSANWPQVRPHINGNSQHTSLHAEMYVCNTSIHVDCIQSRSAHDIVKWFRTYTIMSVPCMNTEQPSHSTLYPLHRNMHQRIACKTTKAAYFKENYTREYHAFLQIVLWQGWHSSPRMQGTVH